MANTFTRESDHIPPDAGLDALKQGAQHCRDCPIGAYATQAVFGEGPKAAKVMLVGEQPGDREDIEGRPFVGPAGRLLDLALERLDWPRDSLYVTNAVKHFKFELRGKRRIHKTPAQREVSICMQWLDRELAVIRPQAIIALGATAAKALAGDDVRILRDRGSWAQRADGVPVLITLHPSALLRGPPAQREAAFEHWLRDLDHASRYVRRGKP